MTAHPCIPKSAREYKLKRDSEESIRLIAQHHVFVERQGWILHPDIQAHIRDIPNPRIADVATGNGVWAIALANQMPNATVTGLDVSAAQFPPEWTWPKNTKFDFHDLLGEVPTVYQHQFDVVHIRLILPAGPSVDSSVIITALQKMLRPGGWLQWDDLTCPTKLCPVPVRVGNEITIGYEAPHPAVLALAKVAKLDERVGWFSHCHERFKQHGFVNAQTIEVPVKPHLLKYESDLSVTVKKRFAEMLIKAGYVALPEAAEELRKLVLDMHKQYDEGQLFTYNWIVGIGRQPLR